MTSHNRLLCGLAAAALLVGLAAHDAHAAIFTVGNDAACTHTTVQGALNALPAGGTHEIRIKDDTYVAQAIKISARVLTLRGGYANCSAASATGTSTLSGAGGTPDSVITITGSGNEIALERLVITKGDETSSAHGGGIDFSGAGKVTTTRVTISNNYAGYGGGINFNASGPSELIIGEDTVIMMNTAQFSGGGIRVEGNATLQMKADRTWVYANEALGLDPATSNPKYGYGGGVLLLDGAKAKIGSPGYGAAGVITDNRARYGGGLAVVAGGSGRDTRADVYGTDAARPVRIEGNLASQTGGGVYVEAYQTTSDHGLGYLCAWDFGLNRNVAQNGSAIYAEPGRSALTTDGADVGLNVESVCGFRPAGAVPCTPGPACNSIAGNRAETDTGQATDGAAILLQDDTRFEADRVALRDNKGGNVLRRFEASSGTEHRLTNVLLAGNQVSGVLVRNSGSDRLTFEDSTFAGNTIGASHVFEGSGPFTLKRSIVWQPNTLVLSASGSSLADEVIVHEAGTLGGTRPTVLTEDPLFLDPAKGDWRPHAASPAVDFSATSGRLDLAGNLRGFNLPLVPDRFGTSDLGAYERVDMLPLVRNGDFDGDLRFWSGGSYDGSENLVGGPGSGVLSLFTITPPVGGVTRVDSMQCVPIPGPGNYLLDGWATIGYQGNRASIGWKLILNDAAGDCSGPVARFGEGMAATDSTWRHMEALPIAVAVAEWNRTTRLAVTVAVDQVTRARALSAKFDGIRLVPDLGDTIFANGFDLH